MVLEMGPADCGFRWKCRIRRQPVERLPLHNSVQARGEREESEGMSVNYRTKTKAPTTLIQAVETSLLAASRYHSGVEERPAAILWTDADGQWQPLVLKLQERLPQLVIYGAYDASKHTGPAI